VFYWTGIRFGLHWSPEDEFLRYAIAIVVGVASLAIGSYGWRAVHTMWRAGTSHLLFDLSRVFGGSSTGYDRGKEAVGFWIMMLINIFIATIFTGFALGVLFLVLASAAALWLS